VKEVKGAGRIFSGMGMLRGVEGVGIRGSASSRRFAFVCSELQDELLDFLAAGV
jgi:hypothetical protein